MTYFERLFMALYLSEPWYAWFSERADVSAGMRLYARCRAVVLFDRVLNNEFVSEDETGKAFRSYFRAETINKGSWI